MRCRVCNDTREIEIVEAIREDGMVFSHTVPCPACWRAPSIPPRGGESFPPLPSRVRP